MADPKHRKPKTKAGKTIADAKRDIAPPCGKPLKHGGKCQLKRGHVFGRSYHK